MASMKSEVAIRSQKGATGMYRGSNECQQTKCTSQYPLFLWLVQLTAINERVKARSERESETLLLMSSQLSVRISKDPRYVVLKRRYVSRGGWANQ